MCQCHFFSDAGVTDSRVSSTGVHTTVIHSEGQCVCACVCACVNVCVCVRAVYNWWTGLDWTGLDWTGILVFASDRHARAKYTLGMRTICARRSLACVWGA